MLVTKCTELQTRLFSAYNKFSVIFHCCYLNQFLKIKKSTFCNLQSLKYDAYGVLFDASKNKLFRKAFQKARHFWAKTFFQFCSKMRIQIRSYLYGMMSSQQSSPCTKTYVFISVLGQPNRPYLTTKQILHHSCIFLKSCRQIIEVKKIISSQILINICLFMRGVELGSMYVQYIQGILPNVPAHTTFIEIYRQSPIFSLVTKKQFS